MTEHERRREKSAQKIAEQQIAKRRARIERVRRYWSDSWALAIALFGILAITVGVLDIETWVKVVVPIIGAFMAAGLWNLGIVVPRRKIVIGARVLAVLALVGLPLGSGLAFASTPESTVHVVLYNPFTVGAVSSQYSVAAHATATSCDPSFLVERGDAFRCFTKSRGYDPCFSSENLRKIVVCPVNSTPWTSQLVELSVSDEDKTFPTDSESATDPSKLKSAWAIELDNGDRCLIIGHTPITLAGNIDRYMCSYTLYDAHPAAGKFSCVLQGIDFATGSAREVDGATGAISDRTVALAWV